MMVGFRWIRDYLSHKETLRDMRREDAIAAERYRQMFFDKVDAELGQFGWYDPAELRQRFARSEANRTLG